MCEYNREIDEIQERMREMSEGDEAPGTSFFNLMIGDAICTMIFEAVDQVFPYGLKRTVLMCKKIDDILDRHNHAKFVMMDAKRSCKG